MATSTQISVWDSPKVYKHHEQQSVCHTRPKYRDGRRPKAVKVYTINLESRYVLVQGVPAIGVMEELVQLLALYGAIEEYRVLDEYPAEEFTEVYLFKFQKLTSARAAKRNTDEKSFYGGLLHVCYAPEYETVDDTRPKLQDRKRYVNRVVQSKEKDCESKNEESRPLTTLRTTDSQDTHEEKVIQNVQVPTKSSSHRDHSQGFPLLPLPPQERLFCHPTYSGHLQQGSPTEDKMGSLQQYIDPNKGPKNQAAAVQQDRESRESNNRPNSAPSSHVRFLPRPTHLDSRKRKAEETESQLFMATNVSDEGGCLIGPQLPEIPKTDLQDASLNITANLIRSTMAKVASVPESKPPEKKASTAKPRRRI